MGSHKLDTSILLLLVVAVFTTGTLIFVITTDGSKYAQEMLAVLSISMLVTPLLFCGFLIKDASITLSRIYCNVKTGLLAAAIFGISAAVANTFWQDWLALWTTVVS